MLETKLKYFSAFRAFFFRQDKEVGRNGAPLDQTLQVAVIMGCTILLSYL